MNSNVYCQASMNYVQGTEPAPLEVTIFNGREADLPGWQDCGFELKAHHSAVTDWADDDEISSVHYQEMAELARSLTGADKAVVSSHIKRDPEQQALHQDLGPIQFVHSDFAESYGDLMRDFYRSPTEEAADGMARAGMTPGQVTQARRMVILQFWRNIGPARMDFPLAFCDARTVPTSDLRPFLVEDYAGGGFNFDTLGIEAPTPLARHKWYVFPDLTIDETITFRTYDSDRVGGDKPFWTPHSAFRDPDVIEGKPARRSIEIRATCFFL